MSLRIGVGLAVVVAGPPLYTLVSSSQIDLATAVLRGGIVAAGCAFGASLVMRIVRGYQREHRAAAARQRVEAAVADALRDVGTSSGGDTPEQRTTPSPPS